MELSTTIFGDVPINLSVPDPNYVPYVDDAIGKCAKYRGIISAADGQTDIDALNEQLSDNLANGDIAIVRENGYLYDALSGWQMLSNGDSISKNISVDSITFPHNIIEEEEVEANRYAVMLDGEMVVDGNIEANDALLTNLNVANNLSAGQLSVTSGGDSDGDVTKITNGSIKVGMRDGVPTGTVTTNTLNIGSNEYAGSVAMIGSTIDIMPTEVDDQIGNVVFQIDPQDKSTDCFVGFFGSPHVIIGSGGYLDLTQDVPICVNDPTEGVEVSLIPTHVTIDGTDYVIMAAVAPQP